MKRELVERRVLAQRAVREWLRQAPEEKSSYLQLARHIGLRNSSHLTWLMRDNHLTPTMERALVMAKLIPPPPDPVLVQPCNVCGEAHLVTWCTNVYGRPKKPRTTKKQRSERKPRPKRFEVVGHDPELALKQLERHYPGRFILCDDSEKCMEDAMTEEFDEEHYQWEHYLK